MNEEKLPSFVVVPREKRHARGHRRQEEEEEKEERIIIIIVINYFNNINTGCFLLYL